MSAMQLIVIFLVLVTWAASIYVLFAKKIMSAIIVTGTVSLIASVLFLLMGAPDVALTEASIGAGLTVAIFVFAMRKIKEKEDEHGDS